MDTQTHYEKACSRRRFMQLVIAAFGAISVGGGGLLVRRQMLATGYSREVVIRLSPAFRVREIASEEIELYTRLGHGGLLRHRFTGVEAGLFRQAQEGQKVETLIATLAQQHQLSVPACEAIVRQSLQEFEEAGLVYYGDMILTKIVEVSYG